MKLTKTEVLLLSTTLTRSAILASGDKSGDRLVKWHERLSQELWDVYSEMSDDDVLVLVKTDDPLMIISNGMG